MNMEEKVIAIINENIEDPSLTISMGTKIQGDLGLDSLSILMILNALEEEFDIHLEEEHFIGVETVGDVIKEVKKSSADAAE
jgi:acyl carrier protein